MFALQSPEFRPQSVFIARDSLIESLVLAGPSSLDPKAAENLDQFVMRGGALVALAGRYRLNLMGGGGGLSVEKVALTTRAPDVGKPI